MSAAERLKPSRRDRRRDALVEACTAFANRLATILDEHDFSEDDDEPNVRPRRKPLRAAYVPNHGQPIDPAIVARARAAARRKGL
jgi:hypothetical protein